MSVARQNRRVQSCQPFECLVCHSRFTRHENLKRHAALHSRSRDEASLPCNFCSVTFSRHDLRHRHMKRKHPEYGHDDGTRKQLRGASASGPHDKRRAPNNDIHGALSSRDPHALSRQHENDIHMGINNEDWSIALQDLSYGDTNEASLERRGGNAGAPSSSLGQQRSESGSPENRQAMQYIAEIERNLMLDMVIPTPCRVDSERDMDRGRSGPSMNIEPTNAYLNRNNPGQSPWNSVAEARDDWTLSDLQIMRGCDLFFTHVSDFLPFFHQPTFNPTQIAAHLLCSILCMAYLHGEDPESTDPTDSGVSLSLRCYHRACDLVATKEQMASELRDNKCLVQSYILLQIYAMMHLGGESSSSALRMHSRMISLAREEGMMQPMPTAPASTEDLDDLWQEFIKAESYKRTSFAVHQIDALWYQLLSIPRSISHLEVKHDLPCAEDHWRASSSTEWAHRELLARRSGLTVQYADAIRRFLSEGAQLEAAPAFDPYGAINIAQFLISSAREISGWSTMTGMLSMDRFGALKSSLIALGPFMCPASQTAMDTPVTLCAATWQIAMIELYLWSPSHTGGVVASSIDVMLSQSASLARSCDLLCDLSTMEAIQPHVDWFLRYLDADCLPVSEAPWVALYGFKAFLIAWQFVRERIPGAMHVVGVRDGDLDGALAWARKAFQQREKWQFGRLITLCLGTLENESITE